MLKEGEMDNRQEVRGGRAAGRGGLGGRQGGVFSLRAGRRAPWIPGLPWAVWVGLACVLTFPAGRPKPKVGAITVRAYHLLYPDYNQTFTVEMNQKFQLADTNLFVAVEDFVPHFSIDTLTHKVGSQSDSLRNPAFKVAVYAGDEKKEEVWAFFRFSVPHFTRQTGLRFEVLKFNYHGKTYRREKPR